MRNNEEIIVEWESLEHENSPKSNRWYIIGGIVLLLAIVVAVSMNNLLFAVIALLGGGLLLLSSRRAPELLHVVVGTEGIKLDEQYIEYSKVDSFSVSYRPRGEEYRLLLVVRGKIRSLLNIPIGEDIDPSALGEVMSEFVEYNPELREPTSDKIAHMIGF